MQVVFAPYKLKTETHFNALAEIIHSFREVFWKSVSLVLDAVSASHLTFIHNAACSQQSQLYSSIKTVIIGFFTPMKLPLI